MNNLDFDASKMSQAPWHNVGHELYYGHMDNPLAHHQQIPVEADAVGIRAMRNALAIQMERAWGVRATNDNPPEFYAVDWTGQMVVLDFRQKKLWWPDPVTAILKADEFVKSKKEVR